MTRTRLHRGRATGFSLIELLVSMVIGLVVALAISTVMINAESGKRSTTSVNDINETGAYVGYTLDRSLRNAGSGFSQNWTDAVGCVLDASYQGQAVLPLPSAPPVPFANVPLSLRLAPVLIGKNMATDTGGAIHGDVIIMMAGMSGLGETPQNVSPRTATSNSVVVTNSLGYNNAPNNSLSAGNLVLLADPTVTAGCMLQQVASANSNMLNFAGNYYKAAGNVVNLTAFGNSTVAIQVGGDPGNPPLFQMFGVGNNNSLYTQDLLKPVNQTAGSATMNPVPVADGIVEMHALYGIDSTPATQKVAGWADPGSAPYRFADLTAGTTVAQTNLHNILAVRIGLILRTSLYERDPVSAPTTLTLFKDLNGLQQTYTISGSNLNYRFRTVEFTVPLRNLYF